MGILGTPLGWVMWALYQPLQNYGLTLLLFTLLSRVILIPMTINQQKSTSKMALVQPQIKELQKKYANNKQKLQEETMALYSSVGYSPTSGCLPMILQFVILFGIIDVIYKPLTHILHLPADVITMANDITTGLGELSGRAASAVQLATLKAVNANPGAFDSIPTDMLARMQDFLPQMNFLGLNLMETPNTSMIWQIFSSFNPIILIPILSGLTSFIFSIGSMKNNATIDQAGGSMKAMMYTMPIFSAIFTFSVPAGVGLYWIYSNLVGMAQNFFINKIYNPKEMAEKVRKDFEEQRERERLERIEAKKKAKERGETDEAEALSKKEQNRRKLAEARRRDAEKYGEDYVEVDDD